MSTAQVASTGAPISVTTTTRATWSCLPPETHLRILEYTDLVAPRRQIRWIAGEGFTLLWEDQFLEAKGSWESPQPLFLVNRTFHRLAADVFWRQNTFLAYPDTKAFSHHPGSSKNSPMPRRYGISDFFTNQLSPQTLPSIRSLKTYFFGQVLKAEADTAQRDWMETVDYAISHGLNLSRLRISGYSFDGHLDEDDLEAAAPSDEEKFEWARRCVRGIVWPLTDDGIPRAISEQLFVKLTFDEVKILYELRNDARGAIPDRLARLENERGPEMGRSHRGTRKIRTLLGEQKETWIETAWVRVLDGDEIG